MNRKSERGIDEISRRPKDMEVVKKITKISSRAVFRRKFSKYSDVPRKLKSKFKSSSGKCDRNSVRYKVYVNKDPNKKYKSFLKHSMCSFGFHNGVKKKKRTVPCPDLPGKGAYNHRFAYGEALRLHQKGSEADVLYKVKNKTNSVYVINGEFLSMGNDRLDGSSKERNHANSPEQMDGNLKADEEKLLCSEELAKMHETNAIEEQERAKLDAKRISKAEKEKKKKYEEFVRKQKFRETEKKLRTEQLTKMLNEKSLKKKAEKKQNILKKQKILDAYNEKRNAKIEQDKLLREKQTKQAKKDRAIKETLERLKRLKLQQSGRARNNNREQLIDNTKQPTHAEHFPHEFKEVV